MQSQDLVKSLDARLKLPTSTNAPPSHSLPEAAGSRARFALAGRRCLHPSRRPCDSQRSESPDRAGRAKRK
eukprot:5161823-Pleurochrysis_carterae.AAC.1